jgi:hypothetical protein
MSDVISHEDVKDFQSPALTPSHTCKPASKIFLSPSDVSSSKTGREKDGGKGRMQMA